MSDPASAARACLEKGVQPALRAMLGKRCIPHALGKRCIPHALGKRCIPHALGKRCIPHALVDRICELLPEVDTWHNVLEDDAQLVAYGLGVLRIINDHEIREHAALLSKIEEAVIFYGACTGACTGAKDTAFAQVVWSNVRHHYSLYTYLTIEETRRLARYMIDKDPRVADPRGFPALVTEILGARTVDTYGAPCLSRGREGFFEQLEMRMQYALHPSWGTIYQN